MRILENKFKIGQKVLIQNYDQPLEWLPAFIVGITRGRTGREVEYWVSDDSEGKYVSDGWPEDRIMEPSPVLHGDELWEGL